LAVFLFSLFSKLFFLHSLQPLVGQSTATLSFGRPFTFFPLSLLSLPFYRFPLNVPFLFAVPCFERLVHDFGGHFPLNVFPPTFLPSSPVLFFSTILSTEYISCFDFTPIPPCVGFLDAGQRIFHLEIGHFSYPPFSPSPGFFFFFERFYCRTTVYTPYPPLQEFSTTFLDRREK